MIVLDTNVLSALMQSKPDQSVVDWLDQQPSVSVWTTSITLFEILFGLRSMAQGKLQESLEEAFDRAIKEDLEGRVLDFDSAGARQAALIAASLRSIGRPVEMRDIQIAGIVSSKKATLVTRNVKHFVDTGISILNPWETA